MKTVTTPLSLLMLVGISVSLVSAQIPNAGFETWSGGEPTGWITDNEVGLNAVVTQSAQSHSGSSALQGTVDTVFGFAYVPLISAGADGEGFPVSSRYGQFTMYYRFSPIGGDRMTLTLAFSKNGNGIGGAGMIVSAAQASYTQLSVPIIWITQEVPDTAYIAIAIVGPTSSLDAHQGSYFLIDDLAFSGTSAVGDNASTPVSYRLGQNYPNPFNPATTISYDLKESGPVSLRVYNAIGQEVATLVNGVETAGSHQVTFGAANLPTGIYFYRLTAGTFTSTRSMMLVK